MRASKSQSSRKVSKIRLVPIALMRTPPALITQREFRKSWGDDLAANLDLNKLGYPIMNFRDGIYWVADGQHRVYALIQNGFENDSLECEVYENLSDAEMAEIFLGRNASKTVAVFDKFHVAVTAGRQREVEIKKIVETNGQKITRDKGEGISSVATVGKIYDQHGGEVLGQVIRTVNLGFGGDPQGFDVSILSGFGLVFNRFNGKTNEKQLGRALSELRKGARGLLHQAEVIRQRTGTSKAQCVAAAVVDLYNKGLGPRAKDRLPSWWKAE